VQVLVIPVVVLIAIGLETCLDWLKKRTHLGEALLGAGVFLVLSVCSLLMLRDALVNGPTWYTDYGLTGMQYGAHQVFTNAQAYQQAHPQEQIYISPNWAFQTLFVLTPDDYQKVVDSGEFKPINPDLVLPYPDGKPGFYFVHLQYRDDIQQFMAAIVEKRHQLIYGTINLDGETVTVGYSALDEGPIDNAFDGNPDTLVKSSEANPLVIELDFPQPRALSGVTVRVGAEPVKVTAYVTTTDGAQPVVFSADAGEVTGYKDITVTFAGSLTATKLRLEVQDVLVPEPSNVHVWEVTLK